MRGEGTGRRALGAATLLLALTIGAPALSSAQEEGAVPPTAEPTPPADPATPPPAPVPPQAPAAPSQGPKDNLSGPSGGDSASPAPASQPHTPAGEAEEVGGGSSNGEAVNRGATATTAASATVSTGDNFYSPASISVFVGDTVTWKNDGATQHSATADDGSFDTGIFGAGQSRSQTFNSPGTFSYFCTVHGQSQSGTVNVRAASSDGGGGGGGTGGGGGGADTAASGPSEAAAVAAPDAAGTSTSLPSTGFPALIMAAIGAVLLSSGLAAGRAADRMEGTTGPSPKRRGRRFRLHSMF